MSRVRTPGTALIETLAVTGIIALVAIQMTPMFGRTRTTSSRTTCGQNMGQIHKAITMYETDYEMYPTRAAVGKNVYLDGDAQEALNLLYRDYADDVRVFSCPSRRLSPALIAKVRPLSHAGAGDIHFRESPPGPNNRSTSYGYSPGHSSINSRVVILADRQGTRRKGNSDNHGYDAGQVVLSAGGSVQFYPARPDPGVPNDLGKDDNELDVIDPDIFSNNAVEMKEYFDWDSFCR